MHPPLPRPLDTGIDGFRLYPDLLDSESQRALLAEVLALVEKAPFYRPVMPRTGTPFSIRMTNLGSLGWVSDRGGYRYDAVHPETGRPWPAIPERLLALWEGLADYPAPPECCLVNFYQGEKAKMGLHRDADEDAADAPVLSLSLGDTALFRIGGLTRRGATRSCRLPSGAVVVLGGPARAAYHGVDRIYPGSSKLLPETGRINLTLRRVTRPQTGGD